MKTATSRTAARSAKSKSVARVPMLDLQRQYAQIKEAILQAVEKVCDSQKFILGEEVAAFEREAAAFIGTADAIGCASGSDALWLALIASGVQPGDSVITTPFSFFATVSSIVRAGAHPVLVDVDARTLNLDPELVAERAKSAANLRAIMPVHLYGQCADMDAFQRIAAEFKVAIIEDAAQAFGASWRGMRAGSMGTAAAFSFYPTKNLSAFGDGGCVTTSNARIAERLRSLRNHGSQQRYFHEEVGWNSRLDSIQAAVLRVKLGHLEDWNRQRRELAASYDRVLAEAGLRSPSGDDSPVRLLATLPETHHIFHQYVIRVEKRDELRAFLSERGIGTEVYYPLPLHLQKCFAYLGYREGDLPEAELAAKEVMALPMFPELTEEEQQYVVESIAEFYS